MIAIKFVWAVLLVAGFILQLTAKEAENSYVKISTDCPDVLAITPVNRDFHLLVTNVSANAHIDVVAIDPWRLVRPESGSCDVKLSKVGGYEVEDAEPDEDDNYEPNKSGQIIMFKPTFTVEPDFPSGMYTLQWNESNSKSEAVLLEGSKGDLTDNYTATVTYRPIGDVATLKGHQAEMSVCPEETGMLLHHPSVDPNSVTVAIDVSRNKWKTSNIYWYGVSNYDGNAGCCYNTKFKYAFNLIVDGVSCFTRSYDVGWPKSIPGMVARVIKPKTSITVERFLDDNMNEKWKAKIAFTDFDKQSRVTEGPYVSQYGEQILAEERYHCDQFTGRVDVAHGGNPDLFTAAGIVCWASQYDDVVVQTNEVYVLEDSYLEALLRANTIKSEVVEKEMSESWNYVKSRRKWAEYQAKEKVNYNAAWRYHCTYGNGSETPPSYEKHPAYR